MNADGTLNLASLRRAVGFLRQPIQPDDVQPGDGWYFAPFPEPEQAQQPVPPAQPLVEDVEVNLPPNFNAFGVEEFVARMNAVDPPVALANLAEEEEQQPNEDDEDEDDPANEEDDEDDDNPANEEDDDDDDGDNNRGGNYDEDDDDDDAGDDDDQPPAAGTSARDSQKPADESNQDSSGRTADNADDNQSPLSPSPFSWRGHFPP